MKIYFFDAHSFEKEPFSEANKKYNFEIMYLEGKLSVITAPLAAGYPCICAFANDDLSRPVLEILAKNGTKLIALRSAGYNHVDLVAAAEFDLKVVRVPEYSPYAVAEHAVALLLTLNRNLHKAYNRVREGNFSLEGLVGFDLHGKTVGVIGTGRIGKVFIKIMKGFGCKVIAFDKSPDSHFAEENNFDYVELNEVFRRSDIISLHAPLNPETHHIINQKAIDLMKDKLLLLNTSRGGLIDTKVLISSLKKGKIAGAGLDVYEEEENYFFKDLSSQVIDDDTLVRLMTFPNVVLTGHQGFLTFEALENIAQTTLANVKEFADEVDLTNEVSK
jgi:D-lactate dehydrogenase